jgi:hypothetical protein
VSEASGWRPLQTPRRASGQAAFHVSRFTRLARVHALTVSVDTLVAMALAGSLFFSIPTGEARGRVALYLLLTMAPFAVVAPLIGPALDRAAGGRRMVVIVTSALRAFVCLFLIRDINSLFLFPEAFAALVLSKAYLVTKSALVPTVVDSDDELVEANSKLSLLSGIVGFAVAAPGVLLLKVGGPGWVLSLAVIASVASAIAAIRLPVTTVAPDPPGAEEEAELRGASILLASSAMGVLRATVGFLTFLLAFDLRGGGRDMVIPVGVRAGRAVRAVAGYDVQPLGGSHGHPAWHFGVVLAVSVLGSLAGAVIAPRARAYVSEERIILAGLVACVIAGLLAATQPGVTGAALIAATVGVSASAAKLGFDSLVQRDAPDANRGRSFARFETRFQLVWVIGAFIPVAFSIPARLGYVMVAVATGFAAFSYVAGTRAVDRQPRPPEPQPANLR